MYLEIDCAVLVVDAEFIGLSLVPQTQREAEAFCHSVQKAIARDPSLITSDDTWVKFTDPEHGDVAFALKEEWVESVDAMLSGALGDLELVHDYHVPFSTGFKIVIAGMEDEDADRIELARMEIT